MKMRVVLKGILRSRLRATTVDVFFFFASKLGKQARQLHRSEVNGALFHLSRRDNATMQNKSIVTFS
jgi:hypothetical protein